MLQRSEKPLKDCWCFPGGFIDYGESAKDATKREVEEETGLKNLKIKRLLGVYTITNDSRGVNIDIVFAGQAEGEIKLSEEHKSYKYFDTNNLPEKITYKHKQAIKDWIKKSK